MYYIHSHIFSPDETVKKHRLRLHQKTRPLVAEICEAKLGGGKDAERFYQKILAVITLLSGLGSPAIPSILRYIHNNNTYIYIVLIKILSSIIADKIDLVYFIFSIVKNLYKY